MQNIQDLLARYAHITPPDAAVKKAVLHSVEEVVGITLHRSDVSVVRGVVYIQSDPTIKSALFVQKEEILKKAQEMVGKENVKEIR